MVGLCSVAEVVPAMTRGAVWLQSNTDHGLAVAFGQFFQQYGLIDQLLQVPITQKTGDSVPQAKLIEFLVGIMTGIEYLSDLNDGPHPVAQDDVHAAAWGQSHFAHYSSVSRTLSACDAQTVHATQQAIEAFSRPFVREAVQELLTAGRVLQYDLDLMGQPVSATSTSYPQVAFGWMDDQVRLGYQLARICLTTPSGVRIWLQGFHHPADTVSSPCLQELVRAAEVQTGVRPHRRPDLVQQRIVTQQRELARPERLLQQQQERQQRLQQKRVESLLQIARAQQALKKPISEAKMARCQRQLQGWQQRLPRLDQQLATRGRVIARHQATVARLTEELTPPPDLAGGIGNAESFQSRSAPLSGADG